MGGEGVDRREIVQQVSEGDLHAERLLQQQRRLRQEERIEAELEERHAWVELAASMPERSAKRLRSRSTRASRRPLRGVGWVRR